MLEFDRLSSYISAALEYAGGTHTLDDVRDGIADGRLQFWPGPNSVMVTEVVDDPRRRTLHFFLAAGTLTELEAMLPPVLEWAKSRGCTHATLLGRAGWARSFLMKIGWHPTAVMMETSL